MEKHTDDAEAYDLGDKVRPVDTEGIRNLLNLPAGINCSHNNQSVHNLILAPPMSGHS
jgi:hypothetical protein